MSVINPRFVCRVLKLRHVHGTVALQCYSDRYLDRFMGFRIILVTFLFRCYFPYCILYTILYHHWGLCAQLLAK